MMIDKTRYKVLLVEIRTYVTIYKFTLGIDYIAPVLREQNYDVTVMTFEAEDIYVMKSESLKQISRVQPRNKGHSK